MERCRVVCGTIMGVEVVGRYWDPRNVEPEAFSLSHKFIEIRARNPLVCIINRLGALCCSGP